MIKKILPVFFAVTTVHAQKGNDVTTPLHALKVDYPVPYGAPTTQNVKGVLDRIYNYLDTATPLGFVDKQTGQTISIQQIDTNTIIKPGNFRLTSYEWGVTYSGMLEAGAATGDSRFTDYSKKRLEFIATSLQPFTKLYNQFPKSNNPFRQPIAPHALDDAGAVCAAMIKALQNGGSTSLRPLVAHYI